ncbi:hypothetical protein G8E03_14480 [Pontibrevibacter nitratireducens]|uniref:Uncharacterized protein n=2 Tax=Pontivivens nitratireducens TaxID=2758038 RepID=A0A6G7VPQ6_9RHOB|nr:hypothetical protein G8E03_14480 [Pontibrevibacter nitratireducens]
MNTPETTNGRQTYLAMLAAVLITVAIAVSLPVTWVDPWMAESGPFEQGSVLCYILAVAVLLFTNARRLWPYAGGLALFALRELDMDKASFFTEGVFKARQYSGDHVSLIEKALSLAILIVVLVIAFKCLQRGLPALLRGLRQLDAVSLLITTGLFLAVLAKSLDGLRRKLASLGIEVSNFVSAKAGIIEETTELGLAAMMLAATVTVWQRERVASDYLN